MLRSLFTSPWLIPLGLALFVGGAKLALVHHFASDQPFNDQWSAEGGGVFRWRLGGSFSFTHYFFPQGEHTPALTRITTVGTALLNAEQWDSRATMLVSIGAQVLSALLLWQVIGLAGLGRTGRMAAAAGVALLLAMPANYENFLWGFQTQFLFLILFGLAHVLGTLRAEQLGASWWLAQVCGLLGLFSIASGVLSSAVLVAAAGWRLRRDRRSAWAWATLGVNLVWVAVGGWLLLRAFFAVERTTGLSGAFFAALGHLLAWPLPGPWFVILTQLPALVWLARDRLRGATPATRVLGGLVLWCWALAAAFAYGRGTGAGEIAVRYQDHLTIGLAVNLILALVLLREAPAWRWRLWLGLWFGVLAAALAWANRPGLLRGNLGWHRDYFARQEVVLRDFLGTNDPAVLARDPEVRTYFPHFDQARDVLTDPLFRLALPSSLAPALAVSPDPARSLPGLAFRPTDPRQPNQAGVLALSGRAGAQRFVSLAVSDDFRPVWRLRVQGTVGVGAGELYLERADGTRIPPLGGDFATGGRWKTVNFLRGEGPVRLVAAVPPGVELKVTEPVELGWLTWLLPRITGLWAWAMAAGAGLLIGSAIAPAQRESGAAAD